MWFQPTFFKLPQYHLLDNQLLLIHLKQYFINLKLICVSVQSWILSLIILPAILFVFLCGIIYV